MPLAQIEKRVRSHFDWPLAVSILLLCSIGLTLLYSAGFNPETGASSQMQRQAAAMGFGAGGFLIAMLFNTNFWRRYAYVIYGIGCLLLVAVLFQGVVAGGARRWLDFGGIRMQPSEFMKVALIIGLARLFSSERMPEDGYSLGSLVVPVILLAIPVGLIMVEPDLGTGLCNLLIGGSMLLLAGVKRKTLLRLALVGLVLTVPAWGMLKDYQQQRILTFISPETDPLGTGYHAIQSKIAVGSGAVTGKGFLQGTQTQLRFLPEQTTDFIFSVLAEEWGFMGSLAVILLYGFLIFRLLKIASRCRDQFPAYVAFGVAAMLFWHVVMNVGMVIGVLPVVGLTLPLLSFGGSSVVAILLGLGLAEGISLRRFLFAS